MTVVQIPDLVQPSDYLLTLGHIVLRSLSDVAAYPFGASNVRLTVVRADASQREWFACNGVAVHAVSRAPLNKALAL